MVTFIYLLIAALIFFVIGYLIGRARCGLSTDRYLAQTPIDINTHDDGSCEDEASVGADTAKIRTEEVTEEDAAQESTKEEVLVAATGTSEEKAKEPVDAAEDEGTKPTGLLDAARDGKKDNITRIKGIGLKIEESLNTMGVYHFDQIAAWTEANTAWVDSHLSFPGRAKREDWIGQAKLLAEGKETEFSRRVDKGEVSSSKKA